MSNAIKQHLLTASDRELDPSMMPLIQKWSDPITSLQILEVVDQCIYGSLASGFVITVLGHLYDAALKREGITHEHNVQLATWRKD